MTQLAHTPDVSDNDTADNDNLPWESYPPQTDNDENLRTTSEEVADLVWWMQGAMAFGG